jgi:4-carboxymuconolactone decarboxylase
MARPARSAKTRFDKGLALRRRVLGDAYVDKARANLDDFTRDFDKLLNEWVWCEIWGRPGLPLKTRSLLNIALLTALNKPEELRLHLVGAINNGCSRADIREVLLHTAIYAGVPASLSAFRIAREMSTDAATPKKAPRRPKAKK